MGDVDKILQEIYGMIAGAPIDIIENQVENGLFRITFNVRGAKTAPTTVFVTRDGRTLFQEPVDLPRRLMQMRTDKVFAECARLAGLHIYGLPTDDGTRQQLAEVGSFAGNVFIDCSVAEQNCAGLGIKSYPTVEFRGKTETGAKPRAFLETLTGCK